MIAFAFALPNNFFIFLLRSVGSITDASASLTFTLSWPYASWVFWKLRMDRDFFLLRTHHMRVGVPTRCKYPICARRAEEIRAAQ